MGKRAMTSLHPSSDMHRVSTRQRGTLQRDTLVKVARCKCDKLPNAEREICCLSGAKRAETTATRGGDDSGNPEAAGRTHDGEQLKTPQHSLHGAWQRKTAPHGNSDPVTTGLFFPKTRFPLKRDRTLAAHGVDGC